MSYGLEVFNSSNDKIVSSTSTLGSLVSYGAVSADNNKYDSAAAANPSWVTNPMGNFGSGGTSFGGAPAWFVYGELVDITVTVPDFINNNLYDIVIVAPTNIIAGNATVTSRQNGSFVLSRNDKYEAYYWIVRKG